jgi:hypothetical protein
MVDTDQDLNRLFDGSVKLILTRQLLTGMSIAMYH